MIFDASCDSSSRVAASENSLLTISAAFKPMLAVAASINRYDKLTLSLTLKNRRLSGESLSMLKRPQGKVLYLVCKLLSRSNQSNSCEEA
jgi:hypothetical protein